MLIEFSERNVAIATALTVTVLGRIEFAAFATAYFLIEVAILLVLLSSAKDNVSEFVWSKTTVYSMVEVIAAKHEADDDDLGQYAVWIQMPPHLHDGFTHHPHLSVEMPHSLRNQYGGADDAIKQCLV